MGRTSSSTISTSYTSSLSGISVRAHQSLITMPIYDLRDSKMLQNDTWQWIPTQFTLDEPLFFFFLVLLNDWLLHSSIVYPLTAGHVFFLSKSRDWLKLIPSTIQIIYTGKCQCALSQMMYISFSVLPSAYDNTVKVDWKRAEVWNCAAHCLPPEKETWSDYSQTLPLSYLWLSHRRGGRDTAGQKMELMMWLNMGQMS